MIALAPVAVAAADEAPDYAADTLSGDWGGLRSDWYERGLAVDIDYRWDMLRVASGGLRRGGRPMDHFDLKAAGDLGKLAGWADTSFLVDFLYDGGGKTNRDHLGSQLGVSNIEVADSTTRVFQAWLQRSWEEGRWALLAGIYPIDTEFQVVDSACLFVQPPYGAAPDLALTRGPSIFNNSAFGLRGRLQSADRAFYGMAAVLDGVPGNPAHPTGTHVAFARGDGAMQIAEFGYRPGDGEGADHSTVLKYAAGIWRYTARVDDLVDVDAAGNPERRRSAGWYALAERTLWRWQDGALAAFLRFGATDGDSTAIQRYYNVGVQVGGLLPGRPDDAFGIGVTNATIGAKYRAAQAAAGTPATDAESAVEVTYRYQARKWLAVQPVIQRYRNPGATEAVPSATVVGLRLELAL